MSWKFDIFLRRGRESGEGSSPGGDIEQRLAALEAGKADKVVYVNDGTTTEAVLAMENSHVYNFEQPLTSLSISSLPAGNTGEESSVKFTTGSSFVITLPSDAKFFGARPAFNVNTTYVLSYGLGALSVGVVV